MKTTLFSILGVLYLWVLNLLNIVKKHKKQHFSLCLEISEPQKEYSWINQMHYKANHIRVAVGPSMGWPEIKQVLRFIEKYNKPTILVLKGDPWNNVVDLKFHIKSYQDWLVTLYNRFQIPSNVIGVQLFSYNNRLLSNSFFYFSILDIDNNLYNKINWGLKYYSFDFKDISFNETHEKMSNLYMDFNKALDKIFIELEEELKIDGFFSKVKLPYSLFKIAWKLKKIKKSYKGKKVALILKEVKNCEEFYTVENLANIILSNYLDRIIISDSLYICL